MILKKQYKHKLSVKRYQGSNKMGLYQVFDCGNKNIFRKKKINIYFCAKF